MKRKDENSIYALQPDYFYYYLDHYYSKSTEEFINKINKGDAVFSHSKNRKMHRIWKYYQQNNLTKQKIEMIENRTKLDLSRYKIELGYKNKK